MEYGCLFVDICFDGRSHFYNQQKYNQNYSYSVVSAINTSNNGIYKQFTYIRLLPIITRKASQLKKYFTARRTDSHTLIIEWQPYRKKT